MARRRGVLFRVWVGAVKGEWGGGREYEKGWSFRLEKCQRVIYCQRNV